MSELTPRERYEKLARETDTAHTPVNGGSCACGAVFPAPGPCPAKIAQALERADINGRIEQAFEDGQLALRVHDDPAEHYPDEVTRLITHEVIPALHKRLGELEKGEKYGTK